MYNLSLGINTLKAIGAATVAGGIGELAGRGFAGAVRATDTQLPKKEFDKLKKQIIVNMQLKNPPKVHIGGSFARKRGGGFALPVSNKAYGAAVRQLQDQLRKTKDRQFKLKLGEQLRDLKGIKPGINLAKRDPDVLSHELGHFKNVETFGNRIRTRDKLGYWGSLLGTIGAVAAPRKLGLASALAGAGISAVLPAEEALASIRGVRATPDSSFRQKARLAAAAGTYAAAPVVPLLAYALRRKLFKY